jgi:hypothetical protein
MTSLRWDDIPEPHVERPQLSALHSKPTPRRKQEPPDFKGRRTEEIGGARIESQDLAGPVRVSKNFGRYSRYRIRSVTPSQVTGHLMCASCRTVDEKTGGRQEPDRQKAPRKEIPVIIERNIDWAARQGANDRKAGTDCRKYKSFLRVYNLPRSQFTLRMWDAYLSTRQPTPKSTARATGRHDPSVSPDAPQKPLSTAVARKDRQWAAQQGREDRIAGKACRKYKTFLITYGLPRSDASLQLWNVYHIQTKSVRLGKPLPDPKQKSRWTRGLTLGDVAVPHRRTVRRCDRVKPRESDLSPENAALLMKVNQQNTLMEMWR